MANAHYMGKTFKRPEETSNTKYLPYLYANNNNNIDKSF